MSCSIIFSIGLLLILKSRAEPEVGGIFISRAKERGSLAAYRENVISASGRVVYENAGTV